MTISYVFVFSALGVDEQNFHKMTDDDLRALHPSLAVQFGLRELRDKKKVMSMIAVSQICFF